MSESVDEAPTGAGRARLIIAAVIVAVLLACGGFLTGRFSAPAATATPTTDSAAAGFLRDMQVHHAQAVDMAMTVRDGVDEADFSSLRLLAYDIAVGQANQAGQMYGLLEAWDLPQASTAPAMQWMSQPVIDGSDPGHGMEGMAAGTMPGLASDADLADLRAATGTDAARKFLTLMIAHHEGGIAMAEAALARTDQPDLVNLATGIVKSQQADITAMQQMLAALPD
ncbi:DUF305 domain-containing protein [soil metagenome]